jgi:hypothetical protein
MESVSTTENQMSISLLQVLPAHRTLSILLQHSTIRLQIVVVNFNAFFEVRFLLQYLGKFMDADGGSSYLQMELILLLFGRFFLEWLEVFCFGVVVDELAEVVAALWAEDVVAAGLKNRDEF